MANAVTGKVGSAEAKAGAHAVVGQEEWVRRERIYWRRRKPF